MQLDGAEVALDISEWSSVSLLDVIRRNLVPRVVEFSRDASRLIALSNILTHVLLFTTRSADGDASTVDAFAQSSVAFHGQVRSLALFNELFLWSCIVHRQPAPDPGDRSPAASYQ